MYRLSLAVAVTAALMSLGTKANAFDHILANGTSLDGVSLEASAGNSVRGAHSLHRQEIQGTSPSGLEEDAHRTVAGAKDADPHAAAAEPAPLTVVAFFHVVANGMSLNGVTLNGGQAQGHAMTEPGSTSPVLAVQAIVLRSGETVELR